MSSRQWRAEIHTNRNERLTKLADGTLVPADPLPATWSAPMLATLEEMAARSPFRLADVRRKLSANPYDMNLKYTSRLTQQLGIDPRPELPAEEGDQLAARIRQIRKRLR